MKRKIVVFGSFLSVFLISVVPTIGSVELNSNMKADQNDPIVVTVRGGLGIYIDIYGVDENTPINAIVSGAYSYIYSKYYALQNRLYIHISTYKLFSGNINLNIYVGDQLWSYNAHSFFVVLVKNITPIEN